MCRIIVSLSYIKVSICSHYATKRYRELKLSFSTAFPHLLTPVSVLIYMTPIWFRNCSIPAISARISNLKNTHMYLRSIYGLNIKSAPFFGDLKNFPETKNNSRFNILKLYFLLHYNQFSCSVTSLLNIALQSWRILFKIRKIDVFWPNRCFLLLS